MRLTVLHIYLHFRHPTLIKHSKISTTASFIFIVETLKHNSFIKQSENHLMYTLEFKIQLLNTIIMYICAIIKTMIVVCTQIYLKI